MFGGRLFFEQFAVERLWLTAFFAPDQLPPDHFNLGLAGLVAADQIADILAVIGEVTAIDLRLDPFVLLLSNGDGLAGSPRVGLQWLYEKI